MGSRVAIIGYSYRFPGQDDANFWQNLLNGRDLVTDVDPNRWPKEAFHHPNKKQPGCTYTFSAGSIGDVSAFDAAFFGISPREAASMDPQQRLLLELSWEAFENSGIKPSSVRGSSSGVYIGIASFEYSYRFADDLPAIDSSFVTGNVLSIAANRISYVFDLHGPSMAVDTACSSAMVAFYQACRSIISGETNLSLAGGISLHLHPYGFIGFSKASMLSKQGRCRVFDASADGYVRSEGGGIFVLKEYDQAIADGNPILAIVANAVANTDGHKSGLTVPNFETQAALLKRAYAEVGIPPISIDYIEAHGTGTIIGDPIEAQAIGEGLGKNRPKESPLPIGSVKSNLGHLEPASGVPGLVKALLCIQHRTVPATIGLKTPNPNIKFKDWNLHVVTQNFLLDKTKKITVGVNSFGFGGANAHVILQSHDVPSDDREIPDKRPPLILCAKSRDGLRDLARNYALFLESQEVNHYYDIAYSATHHRDWHEHRAIVFGESIDSIVKGLREFAENPESTNSSFVSIVAPVSPQGAAFIYSGNGSQWSEMGKHLLEDTIFLKSVREVDALFQKYADFSIEAELAGRNGEGRFEYTENAQPALFALQVGLTQMLRHAGIKPTVVAGHSVGEIAAAWAAGILSLPHAVQVAYYRSNLQGKTKGTGQMTAVAMSQNDVRTLLEDLGIANKIFVAGINSSRGVTIAGDSLSLGSLEAVLVEKQIRHKRLDLDYAFHSPAMDEIEESIRISLASMRPQNGTIPFFSTVTGDQLEGSALNADYWWRNIRQPVLFESAIRNILGRGDNLFIEVGPHPVLIGYMNDSLRDADIEGRVIATIRRDEGRVERVRNAASEAIIAGADIDWQQLFPATGRFVHIPNYPWQRESYWLQHTSESLGLLDRRSVHPLLGYPLKQHHLIWENQLDSLRFPLLADHVVGDATVFPASGFVEIVLAAAHAWHPEDAIMDIEELEIGPPLLLSDQLSKETRLNIEPKDGSFTIISHEYTGSEPWVQHAQGRILVESKGLALLLRAPSGIDRQPDFFSTDHEMLTRASGLDYGPTFRCIHHGWIDGNKAVAILDLPDVVSSNLEQMHLHPGILDCGFQLIFQLLKEDMDLYQGMVFLPTKIGRIVFRSDSGQPHLVRATLLRVSPHSLTAEFELFDDTGKAIAVIKEARFRKTRLESDRTKHLNFLSYHSIPKPHPYTATPAPLRFDILKNETVEMVSGKIPLDDSYRYVEEVEPLLDSLCSQFAIETFQQLADNGEILTNEVIRSCQINAPNIVPFLNYLIQQAEEDLFLLPQGRSWQIHIDSQNPLTAKDIWNILIADYPDYFGVINTVGRIGLNLESILKGRQTLLNLLSPNSTIAVPIKAVMGTERRHKLGCVIRELISQSLTKLPQGRRLSLMEISQETPLFAMNLRFALDFDRCDYTFATTSQEVLDEAARMKETHPELSFRLIEHGLEGDIIPANLFHFIILTLDFDQISQSLLSLNYARSRLAVGGTLLLVGQHPSRWIDFVFGAHPGWFQESEEGWLSNQRSIKFWQRHILQLDLISENPIELSPGKSSDIFLIPATPKEMDLIPSPNVAEPIRNWIILTDCKSASSDFLKQLEAQLNFRGSHMLCASVEDIKDYSALLDEFAGKYGQIHGIVHMAGFNPSMDYAEDMGLECVTQQTKRCAIAAHLARACEKTGTSTTIWILTTGAVDCLLPKDENPLQHEQTTAAADSVLWGFARTLMNEASNYTVRLIDVMRPITEAPSIIDALLKEFDQADDEQEILLTNRGERFVPRLRIEPIAAETKTFSGMVDSYNDSILRLGFESPGQLRNLHWKSAPAHIVENDGVEIEVRATGLNFRDLMYTLGLFSDEAVENGFAGASLGLEFSGTVMRTGTTPNGFCPGDRVLGFGPFSFANRVATKTTAIAHIPTNMSYEAAATIPSVFFTAYYGLKHLAGIKEGEKILIHGAAGGVGIAAIQLAKLMGVEIYATAGSDHKRDFLRLLGADHIYDSRSLAFAEEILIQTAGKGVDVVLNSLAGEAINRSFQVLKPFGRFLELGKRDFYENTKIGLRPFRNNISYFGIDADQLMLERPDLSRALFTEVMEMFHDGRLKPLPYHVFQAEDITDAFRYMQQARHIGKIVVTYPNKIEHVERPLQMEQHPDILSANGTYLVTGGLDGFGLKTAEWLAQKGARHLVLISRRGPTSNEAKQAIQRMEQQGVDVLAESCDVTVKSALKDLLEKISAIRPPLKGIVHAAVVFDDGLIVNMDAEQIRRVLAPKILGAQYLHELTLDQQLDFFILFSSATTLFGNPGQANYVAANCWLEALAHNRRAMGLPATSVSWGAIDDVGFLARNKKIKETLQSRMGGSAINSASALEKLENLLTTNRSGLGVMELDWRALSRFLPNSQTPKFSEIARKHEGIINENDSFENIDLLLDEFSDDELSALIIKILKSELSEILRISPDKIDATRSLNTMGLDSLMGVELSVAVEARFGIRLPVMALRDNATLTKLSHTIIAQLKRHGDAETAVDAGNTLNQAEQLANQHGLDTDSQNMRDFADQLTRDNDNNRIILNRA